MKQQKNKEIWPKSQHLGLTWSQHQVRKPLGVSIYDGSSVNTRPNDHVFIHQNINYLQKEYNSLLINDR